MASPRKAQMALASAEQLATWVKRFRGYRLPPTAEALEVWLRRFGADVELAHKVLDQVRVVPELEIQQGYKKSLESLPGWDKVAKRRKGRWYFVGVGSAGESGTAMIRPFREANGLANEEWHDMFVSMRDLPYLGLSAYDHVVFIDDFSGSGKQISKYWPTMLELVASDAKCYLVLTAITFRAAKMIEENTDLRVVANIKLGPKDDVFDAACKIFSDEDRRLLAKFGKIASPKWPRGHENCGLTFVLSHKTPNNSLPILHANHSKWRGPFPRYLIASDG